MNILFAADRGYLRILSVCIRSIVRFDEPEGYVFYILHSDLTAADRQGLTAQFADCGCEFRFVEVDERRYADFPVTGRYPRQIYYRIFAAQYLPADVGRVLYLDGDTVAIRPLRELYDTDFQGKCFCACTHVRRFLNAVTRLRLGIRGKVPYPNTGVLLMNLSRMRARIRFDDVRAFVVSHRRVLALPDQDVLAALYGDEIRLLPGERFNLSDRTIAFRNADPRQPKIDLDWVRREAVVIHYCGKNKPWKPRYRGILDVFYREVAAPSGAREREAAPSSDETVPAG